MKWLSAHKGWILNVLTVAGPVVAGFVSGGVFTLPVIIATATGLVGKLAASPLNHAK